MIPIGRCLRIAFAAAVAGTIAVGVTILPVRAQAVPTHVTGDAPVRIDDAYATFTYACVSFTNEDKRTANSVEIGVRFLLANGSAQSFSFMRLGSFATGVPIEGPAQKDQHTSPSKLLNCAAIDAPDDAQEIQFSVTHVGFEDGSEWIPSPPKQ